MKEKTFEYGTEYNVEVISSSDLIIGVHEKTINEAFLLIGHGEKTLPDIGDKGKIIFSKGGPKSGYWKWYPENKSVTPEPPNTETTKK